MKTIRQTARRRTGVMAGVLVCLLALGGGGCSLLFVQPAPSQPVPVQNLDCTTNYADPIVDTVLAALGGLFTLGITSICFDTCGERQNYARLVLAVPFVALPAGSAIYGYRKVGGCRAAHRQ
jgi:hypothetical protein